MNFMGVFAQGRHRSSHATISRDGAMAGGGFRGVAVWAYSKSLNLGLGILVHNLSRFMTPELTPPAGIGSMTMIEVSRSRLGSNICFFFLSRLGVKNKGTHKLLNHDFLEKVRNLEVRS